MGGVTRFGVIGAGAIHARFGVRRLAVQDIGDAVYASAGRGREATP